MKSLNFHESGLLWRHAPGIRSLGSDGGAPVDRASARARTATVPAPAMNRRYPTAALPLICLLAGSLVGCQSQSAEVYKSGACSSDADCVGAICHEGRFCVQTPTKQSEAVLNIRPQSNSGLVLEQFVTVIGGPDHDQERKWNLTPAAVVHGTISRGGIPPTGSVPGSIIATSMGILPGTVLSYETSSYLARKFTVPAAKDDAEATDKSYGFELLTQAGRSYDITFWPQIEEIPPYYTERFVGGNNDVWLVELPDEAELMAIRGRMVFGSGQPDCAGASTVATCGEGCAGLAGLQVRLVDGQGRLRSTRATTNEAGEFEVHADPSASQVWLKFRPEDVDQTLPHGAIAEAIYLSTLRFKSTIEHDLGLIHLGDLPAPSALVQVRPRVLDGDKQPVVGARLTFRQDRISPRHCVAKDGQLAETALLSELFYTRSGLTDIHGRVKVAHKNQEPVGGDKAAPAGGDKSKPDDGEHNVYDETMAMPEGDIWTTILPPTLAAAASWRETIHVAKGTDQPTIVCPRRPVVRGAVTDFRGRSIIAATVLFKPLLASKPDCAAAQPEEFPRPEAAIVVQADENGDFVAPLDPGRFAVLVNPPKDSGLARALIKVFDLCALDANVADPVAAGTVLDLTVPPPTLLRGRVYGPGGSPVVGAVVDVLAMALTKLPAAGEAGAEKPPVNLVTKAQMVFDTQVIGSALTGGDGRYEVLVAAGQLAEKD